MRKEKSSFLGLQELTALNHIHCLNIDEILKQDYCVINIESCSFFNSKFNDEVLQLVKQAFVHALLVAYRCNF